MHNRPPSPVRELRDHLRDFAARCRASRLWDALFGVRVCQDILADEEALLARAGAAAHRAETSDREAVAIIDGLIRDPRIPAAERTALRSASRLASRAAETTHDLGEMVATD